MAPDRMRGVLRTTPQLRRVGSFAAHAWIRLSLGAAWATSCPPYDSVACEPAAAPRRNRISDGVVRRNKRHSRRARTGTIKCSAS